MKSALQTLEIKRYIAIDHPDAPPALVSTTCIGGHINVIQDQDGAHILPFAKALCGEDIDVKHTITLGGSSFDPNRSYRVGFKETLPENIKVKDYLLSIGAPCESVDNLIDEFELDKYGYLTCSQLSPTATRQVFLLGLQWQNSDVIVLNDPFMPFNGRWREYFAELVLREAKKSDKIVVVLNLSFVPQAWAKSELIRYTDIGQSADAARQKALLKANGIDEQKALEEQKVKEESAKKSLANIAELKEGKTIHIPIPENLTYAYQHTRDFIFSPFLRITWMLRTYSSPAVILSSAFVLLLGAIVMFPDLSAQRAKLVELAKNFDFEWKDVTTSETSSGEQQTEIQVKSIPTLDNDEDLSEQEQPDLPLEQVTIDDDTELEESDETLHETALPVANVKWIEACALPLISDCLANPTLDHGCDGFFE